MSQCQQILAILGDGKWHSTVELNDVCWGFGQRLFDLRKKGYIFDKAKHPELPKIEMWRLIGTPEVEGSRSEKMTQVSLI